MKKEQTTVDIDFAEAAVPQYARRGIVTMFMIMLGFTFFSASMWVDSDHRAGRSALGQLFDRLPRDRCDQGERHGARQLQADVLLPVRALQRRTRREQDGLRRDPGRGTHDRC